MHLLALLMAATATAATPTDSLPPTELRLAPPPTWSLALAGYGALGVASSRDAIDSYPVAGATLRARVWYAQLGGYAEVASLPSENLIDRGGLAGAHLPFVKWVDVDVALGLGLRTYTGRDFAGGLGDYRASMLAGSVRTGVSDRTGGRFGLRLGAELISSFEFAPQSRSWVIEPNSRNRRGSHYEKHFGGLAVALALTVAVDVAP